MTHNISEQNIKKAQSIKDNAEEILDLLVKKSVDSAALMTSLTIVNASVALLVHEGDNPTEFLNTLMERTEELYAMIAKSKRIDLSE